MKKHVLTLALAATATLTHAQELPVYMNPDAPLEARVEDALSRMTLDEKVRLSYAQSKFSSPGVPRLGIPEIWMSDGPHGVRAEVNWNDWGYSHWTNDSVTAFPALTCLAASWNPELATAYGTAVGEEARYRKKSILLGPGVNIYRTPLNGRNFEYMGEDPFLSGSLAAPYIRAVQANGVASCLKHFALNDQEEYRGHIDVHVSERALNEIYLKPFRMAVQQGGLWSIMGSYNKYNGTHCCHNDTLLNQILKRQWGFDGVVVTDWGGAHDTREAIFGGLDIEMGSYTNGLTSESEFTYDDYYLGHAYRDMARRGEVPQSVVDDKARRILRLIFRTELNADRPWGSLCTQEHFDVARAIADEGIVLLKNDKVKAGKTAAPLLPIDAATAGRILVVGENATRSLCQGGGSSELKPKVEISPLEGLRARFGADRIDYAQGYKSGRAMYGHADAIAADEEVRLRQEAVAKAKDADLIIYVGGLNKNHFQDCEGGDRQHYHLPFGQDALIEALLDVNPRLVMVLISGNAVEMPWLGRVPALVQSWYNGTVAGLALADILSGDVCPSGKTPFSYPTKLTDCPANALGTLSYPGDSIREEYLDDIFVGYRWHDLPKAEKQKFLKARGVAAPVLSASTVTFPFGYGLSYTSFQYGKPTLSASTLSDADTLTVRLTVRNTGAVAGKETVQLYVGGLQAGATRPVKELRAFRKVALAPGGEAEVEFRISAADLAVFDEKTHAWVTEPGKFRAYVAASAADVRGTADFTLR